MATPVRERVRKWRQNPKNREKERANQQRNYEHWKEWVKNNPERRREIARRSYHRRKAIKKFDLEVPKDEE